MQANQRESRHFEGINLGWATVDLRCDQDSIVIQAVKVALPTGYSDGYLYRACIKWDPNATWKDDIPGNARPWEVKQRGTPLLEMVLGKDYRYDDEPWDRRPPIERLVCFLMEEGATDIADRVEEAYQRTA